MKNVEEIKEPATSLVWFRNDLRINDQHSLYKACSTNSRVLALYCFSPYKFELTPFGFNKTGKFRAQFLRESVENLKQQLKRLNISLLVYFKEARDVIPKLIEDHNITQLFFQEEWTDEELKEAAFTSKIAKIQITKSFDQFLIQPEDLPFKMPQLPSIFTEFRKKVEKNILVNSHTPIPRQPECNVISNDTKIPTLSDLGLNQFKRDARSAFPCLGGEQYALEHLHEYTWSSNRIMTYKKTRNSLVGINYSSKLSPWLSNGSLSARTIYNEVKKYEREVGKNQSTYWLIFELLWRDYFKFISLKYANKIFQLKGITGRDYVWSSNPKKINNWIDGLTSEPFVNANMIELKKTGWMSNRGRQNVASYFAKELELDWRIGASYFESLLIDYDVHSNYGNWMYVAGVGNDPRDRKFNIKLQAQRYDPDQKFQKLWLIKDKYDA